MGGLAFLSSEWKHSKANTLAHCAPSRTGSVSALAARKPQCHQRQGEPGNRSSQTPAQRVCTPVRSDLPVPGSPACTCAPWQGVSCIGAKWSHPLPEGQCWGTQLLLGNDFPLPVTLLTLFSSPLAIPHLLPFFSKLFTLASSTMCLSHYP